MGGVSIALSLPIVWWAFTPPYNEFKPITPVLAADFLLFIVSSLLMVWLASSTAACSHRSRKKSRSGNPRPRDPAPREEHPRRGVSLIRQSVTQKDEASRLIDRIKAFTGVPNPLDDSDPSAASSRPFCVKECRTG